MKKSKLSLNYLWIIVFVISSFCFSTFSVFASGLGDDLELQEVKKKMQLLEYDQKYDQKYTNLEKIVGNFFDTEKVEIEKLKNEVENLDKISDDRWNLLDNQVNIFALIVGILSLGVPIFGWIGYKGIRNKVEKELEEAKDKIAKEIKEMDEIEEEGKKYLNKIKKTKEDSEKYSNHIKELATKQYITSKDKKTLKENIKEAKKNAKEESVMFFLLGYDSANNKDYEQAKIFYSKAIELNKNFMKAYNNRGNANYEMKNYIEAINDYTKAIELDKNYAAAYGNLAEILFLTDKKKDAELYLKRALNILRKEKKQELFLAYYFSNYAFYGDDDKKWRKAKKKIEGILKEGIRAPRAYLNASVQKAWDDEHPDKEDVLRLAEEITGLKYFPEEKLEEEK